MAARRLLAASNMALLNVVEENLECRKRLGPFPLLSAVDEFIRRSQGVKLQSLVPVIVAEFLEAKQEDQASKRCIGQLKPTLGRFSKQFPGEILSVQSSDIDHWLRSMKVSPATRNGMLRCFKVLFSFAKSRSY